MTTAPDVVSMRAVRVPEVPEALRLGAESLRATSGDEAMRAFREAAWSAFERHGVPHSKHEEFSYVSPADLKSSLTRMPEASGGDSPRFQPVKGLSVFTLSDAPAALSAAWTSAIARETDAPAALAAALAPEPTVVRIGSPSFPPASPLPLRFSANAGRGDHAVFVRVEPGVEASLSVETDAGPDGFVNALVHVSLGEGARLDVYQRDTREGVQMVKLRFAVERDARLNLLAVSTGARLARLALEADLLAPGAAIDLRGAAALSGNARCHRYLMVRHAAPDCTSRQLFKAVVGGSARSSVDGTVIVERGAQRTDAKQLLQHRLLSSDARGDAKPRLLIHADDVKCGHGATAGKTDPAQLFYLLSRGLDKAAANALLTRAFLGEALDIAPEDARAAAWELLSRSLNGGTL